jgi:hypothetical protein
VSNSDNLGATVDLRVLSHMANTSASFLMEVTERTAADRKGGHLARRKSGRTPRVARVGAVSAVRTRRGFQNIAVHRLFNTNNLWLRLDHLRAELERNNGMIPLPLIRNAKTVDPSSLSRPKCCNLSRPWARPSNRFSARRRWSFRAHALPGEKHERLAGVAVGRIRGHARRPAGAGARTERPTTSHRVGCSLQD